MDEEVARWLVGALFMGSLFGGAGWAIGRRKERGGLGFVLGFFFWLLGIILIACINRSDDDGPRPGLP